MRRFDGFWIVIAVMLALILGGCGKKDSGEYADTSSSRKPEGFSIEGARNQQLEEGNFAEGEFQSLDQTGRNPLAEDSQSAEHKAKYGRSTPPLLPVYFAFDSSAIDVDQLGTLRQSGSYLLENSSIRLLIEGNCDERGTPDYNLALGELRAISVRKYLQNMGVAPGRISTISYGSQRPLFPGSDERSWAKNRRADLVIP